MIKEGERNESVNRGKLILDATCAPADIKYPTDLGLLNQAREQTEKIVDILYNQLEEKAEKKPRMYRGLGRKEYLEIAKKRRPSKKKRGKAIKNATPTCEQKLRIHRTATTEWCQARVAKYPRVQTAIGSSRSISTTAMDV